MKKLIIGLCCITLLSGCDELFPQFECNDTSAERAAEIINEKTDLGGALELTEPKLIRREKTHLYCRAKSNIGPEFIDYEMIKKTNGEIYVIVDYRDILGNPFENALREMFDDL